MSVLLRHGVVQCITPPKFELILSSIDTFVKTGKLNKGFETDLRDIQEFYGANIGVTLYEYIRDSTLNTNDTILTSYKKFEKFRGVLDLMSEIFSHDFSKSFVNSIEANSTLKDLVSSGMDAYKRGQSGESTEQDELILSTLALVSKHQTLEFIPFEIELPTSTFDEPKLCDLKVIVENLADDFSQFVGDWKNQMITHLFESFGRMRISELFDIIVDFPESKPALIDLKECLSKVNLDDHLVNTYKASLRKRLLHAGAQTPDIIIQFISTVRSFSIIDQTGRYLKAIMKDITDYLMTREDTI
ncbi:anaphase-promoting complex subunit 2, partial [Acrasis kona]